jgi:hypothetical protein
MKSHNVLAVSCLLSGMLVGCNCPKCPAVAAQPAQPGTATGTSCNPNPVTDPKGEVTAGTYCTCNAGDHNAHGDYTGFHLPKGQAVVIPDPNMVTDVQLGGYTVPMILSSDKHELNGFADLPHEKTAGGSGTVTHAVRIMPVTVGTTPNGPSVAGCVAGKNTLKISFCSKDENGDWPCKPPGGDYGDTHVQN